MTAFLAPRRVGGWLGLLIAFAVTLLALPAFADPTFPPLTGRVVDDANLLSPATETALTGKLADLENKTGRQLVVVTLPSLQGYEIEDYGYQLGRKWGIGDKKLNDGALLIVAPKERKVRIEVGYGLEPVLTDALSSVILQSAVLPKFKAGDMEGGVVAGTDALLEQLALPDDQARARVAQATAEPKGEFSFAPFTVFIFPLLFFVLILVMSLRRGLRGRGDWLSAAAWTAASMASSRDSDSGWGGGGGGGGGFSGGGGSFGGGGSSGSW